MLTPPTVTATACDEGVTVGKHKQTNPVAVALTRWRNLPRVLLSCAVHPPEPVSPCWR